MARRSKQQDQNELNQPEEETFFLNEQEFEREWKKNKLKVTGIIRLITPTRIIIIYGNNLGTSMEFDPSIHSKLKVGDEIEF